MVPLPIFVFQRLQSPRLQLQPLHFLLLQWLCPLFSRRWLRGPRVYIVSSRSGLLAVTLVASLVLLRLWLF